MIRYHLVRMMGEHKIPICDAPRGGMNASQHEDVVLTSLFMKNVPDKHKGDRNGMNVVPECASFDDMVAQKGKEIVNRSIRLIGTFEGLDISANRADGDDLPRLSA